MKYGFSQCNFSHMDMFQCIEFAKSNGFDFLEAYWEHVTDTIINDGEKFADVLKKSDLNLTIHHALLVEKRTDEFERSILVIKDCHDSILNGTVNYEEIIKILYKLEFDGYVDFELVPELHNKYGDEADKMLLEDFEFWKNIRRNVKENEKEE